MSKISLNDLDKYEDESSLEKVDKRKGYVDLSQLD